MMRRFLLRLSVALSILGLVAGSLLTGCAKKAPESGGQMRERSAPIPDMSERAGKGMQFKREKEAELLGEDAEKGE